jgi:ribosomal protein S3AE
MAGKVKTSNIPNWKRKRWYPLIAPAVFGDKVIGETFCESPDQMIGRVAIANVMNLMGIPRRQNFTLRFRVVKVADNKGFTKPISLKMLPASVRRLIRSGKERLDLSFTAKTKEGVVLRMKPLIVTANKANNSTLSDLRRKAEEVLSGYINQNSYEAVFAAAVQSSIQREFKKTLDRVTPVKVFEIKTLEVELVNGRREIFEGDIEVKPVAKSVEEVAPVAEEKPAPKAKKPRKKKEAEAAPETTEEKDSEAPAEE